MSTSLEISLSIEFELPWVLLIWRIHLTVFFICQVQPSDQMLGLKRNVWRDQRTQLLLHGGCMWLLLNNKFISCLQALSYKSSAVRVTLHYRNVGILKTSAGVFAVMSTPTVSKCDVSVVKNIWDFIWKSLITLAVQARGSLISCTDTSWRIFIKIRQNYWDASPLPDQAGDVNAVASDTLGSLGS